MADIEPSNVNVREQERDDAPRERRRSRSRSRSRSPVRERRRSPSPHRHRERSRSPRHDRSRSRSPRRMDVDGDRDRDRGSSRPDRSTRYASTGTTRGPAYANAPYDPMRKAASREIAASEAAKRSRKECRVYVGNLAFGVKWNDLKDFMREAGNVVFSEIMLLPNGMSKGCGVVEYSTPEEAQRAITQLNDQQLLGRPVFIREDRENEARYGAAAVSTRPGFMGPGGYGGAPAGGRGGYGSGFGGRGGAMGGPVAGSGRHLYITGLPYTVGWQDLKDLFRAAGQIIRADVKMAPDGTHTGVGTVVYETPADAQNAIAMYNGFDFQGSVLEVREDRFPSAGGGGRGGYGGGAGRGGYGGGFGGRGAFAGAGGPAAAFGAGAFGGAGAYGFAGAGAAFGIPTGPGAFAGMPVGPAASVLPPSNQIYVRNLPWSTSNEDLVELFQTCGTVEQAEVLFEHGRPKGAGVVQFASIEDATTAVTRFNGYVYGGRPLALDYNQRPYVFAQAMEGIPTGPADMSGGAPAVEELPPV